MPAVRVSAVSAAPRAKRRALLLLLSLATALFVVYHLYRTNFATPTDTAAAAPLPMDKAIAPVVQDAPAAQRAVAPKLADNGSKDAAKRAPAPVRPADVHPSPRSNRPAPVVVTTHSGGPKEAATSNAPEKEVKPKDATANGATAKDLAPVQQAAPLPATANSTGSAARALQPVYPRVTHTKPLPAGTASAAAVAATDSVASPAPPARPSGCTAAIEALGLCRRN